MSTLSDLANHMNVSSTNANQSSGVGDIFSSLFGSLTGAFTNILGGTTTVATQLVGTATSSVGQMASGISGLVPIIGPALPIIDSIINKDKYEEERKLREKELETQQLAIKAQEKRFAQVMLFAGVVTASLIMFAITNKR